MANYEVDPNKTSIQVVGILPNVIVQYFSLECPSREVKMYPGAIKHIKRHHPGVFETYYHLIPGIIERPDYVGQNPRIPNSVELIKVMSEYLLLAVKLDPTGYFFVSSLYGLDNGAFKVQKRLKSGRLVPFSSLDISP